MAVDRKIKIIEDKQIVNDDNAVLLDSLQAERINIMRNIAVRFFTNQSKFDEMKGYRQLAMRTIPDPVG